MLFWKDVGNGILLDRPLPFKLHQSYRPLPCFIPALQDIWSDPAKNCGDDGDDLNTAVASHYRGEAVMRLSSQPYWLVKRLTNNLVNIKFFIWSTILQER